MGKIIHVIQDTAASGENGKRQGKHRCWSVKTFRGVLRASALALSLMDLSLGPAISIYMTLALPIHKQHSYNASALLCPAISHI